MLFQLEFLLIIFLIIYYSNVVKLNKLKIQTFRHIKIMRKYVMKIMSQYNKY